MTQQPFPATPKGRGIRAWPVKFGFAEIMGLRDRGGRGFGVSTYQDAGLEMPPHVQDYYGWWEDEETQEAMTRRKRDRLPLPPGHRFFPDCERETNARLIQWFMTRASVHSWFVTLTFKAYISEETALKRLSVWIARLQESYKHVCGDRGLNWICATEWQKRDVIHFHLIVSGARLDALSRKRWEHRWEAAIGGGFARIHDARMKAAPYLAKYTSKTLGGDLRWNPTWQGAMVPESVSCCMA